MTAKVRLDVTGAPERRRRPALPDRQVIRPPVTDRTDEIARGELAPQRGREVEEAGTFADRSMSLRDTRDDGTFIRDCGVDATHPNPGRLSSDRPILGQRVPEARKAVPSAGRRPGYRSFSKELPMPRLKSLLAACCLSSVLILPAACDRQDSPFEPGDRGPAANVERQPSSEGGIRLARVMEPKRSEFANPTGLAFQPEGSVLLIVGREPGAPSGSSTQVGLATLGEETVGFVGLDVGIADPVNLTVDPGLGRLIAFDAARQELVEVDLGPGAALDDGTVARYDASAFGVPGPSGLAVDPRSGRLYLLDAASGRIVTVAPDGRGGYEGGTVAEIALPASLRSKPHGLAVHPGTGHLFTLEAGPGNLYELTPAGELVATFDVSQFGLRSPAGMVFAPSGDATDDPREQSLYVAETGAGGGAPETGGTLAETGFIAELSFDLVTPGGLSAAALEPASLVQTIETWAFTPPSPDPAGIAWIAHLGHLMISDSEVNEVAIYAGANLFEITAGAELSGTYTTLSYSDEPTDITYNPANRHLFISDDDQKRIFEIDPGSDGEYGTGDDAVASFSTSAFGSGDPEGVTYDFAEGVLYIVDGVNSEIYRVAPGLNGRFDGVAPMGDDQVSSFDTETHGLLDPEGIAYDSDFGHIYAVGKPPTTVFHFTTAGDLIRTLDISAANADKPAGLAYAPGSDDPARMHLWIVDRMIDNQQDPNENDGRAYEFAPTILPGNLLPSVTITTPGTGAVFTEGDLIEFSGTAVDIEDGDLTGSLAWTSSLDGTIGSGGSFARTDLSVGIHTIRAHVTDGGGLEGSSVITLLVKSSTPGEGPGLLDVRITESLDDAEQNLSGSMRLTSSDLELTYDGGDQIVGLRFPGLEIPPGAQITRAYVQFTVDEESSEATSLLVRGQASDDALPFESTRSNISNRPPTLTSASWTPPAWNIRGVAGPDQQTPDISAIVQEIVDRPGWESGNALGIVISGTGHRVAVSGDGTVGAGPLIHVEWGTSETNLEPEAAFTWQATDLSVAFTDTSTDPDGSVATWSWDFGDGSGSSQQSPTHVYAAPGAYTVTLTVTDDDGASGQTSQSVTATAAVTVTIAELTPSTVSVGFTGGVTINGSGFAPGATVTFENGTLGPPPDATEIAVLDSARIQITLTVKSGGPKRDRTWDVRVTNPDGSTASLPAGLQIRP